MFSGPADSFPRLVGDIGGTNARFGLIEKAATDIDHVRCLNCADYPGPLEAIRHYLEQHPGLHPRHAAIGIANPVAGDYLRMTNNDWAFSVETLRQTLNMQTLIFINDFTALALSLPHLKEQERRQVGPGDVLPGHAIGVIGPGTGLGVSGLVPGLNGYVPLSGEGGHVSLAPATDEEFALTALLQREYGHVSAERVLSGPGLLTLHRALATLRDIPQSCHDSAAITEAALAGQDPLSRDTLNTFCALLGSTAGNLALTLGARSGVYIGGGIVPRLGEAFDRSPFRSRFEAKGRFQPYLAAIPTLIITASQPALTGAAAALAQHLS